MIERVDAHHHLWKYSEAEYGWIGEQMQQLRQDFLVANLEAEMAAASVDAAAVQARHTLDETRWLLHLADRCSSLRGVVG